MTGASAAPAVDALAQPAAPAPGCWIACEKNGQVIVAQASAIHKKNISLVGGDKIPKNKAWLTNLPPPSPAFSAQISAARQALPAEKLWRAAGSAPQTLHTLDALAAAAMPATAATAAAAPGSSEESAARQVAILKQVLQNPIYFRRRMPHITAAPADIVARALAAMEKRRQQQEEEDALARALADGQLPPSIRRQWRALLFSPDSNMANTADYRALKRHLRLGGGGVEAGAPRLAAFFIKHGLLDSELTDWEEEFRRKWEDTSAITAVTAPAALSSDPPPLPAAIAAQRLHDLPHAAAAAISIDTAGTKEIDDAFSITPQADAAGGEGSLWRVGIHIAAPALALSAAADAAARQRQSSAYFPHRKYFMLPPEAVAAASLAIDAPRAAISLYLHINTAEGTWQVADTVLEQVTLARALTPDTSPAALSPPLAGALENLQRAADVLAADVGCSQTAFHYLISPADMTVTRHPRQGLSRMVEIFMRAANTVWAEKIRRAKIGGLFRANSATLLSPPPATRPYMWLTSPLRRYADLANQRLLLAVLGGSAPPPENWRFLQKYFSARYTLAARYQSILETRWALAILSARRPPQLTATLLAPRRARLHDYPLVGELTAPVSAPAAPAAADEEETTVRVCISSITLLPPQLRLTVIPS